MPALSGAGGAPVLIAVERIISSSPLCPRAPYLSTADRYHLNSDIKKEVREAQASDRMRPHTMAFPVDLPSRMVDLVGYCKGIQ